MKFTDTNVNSSATRDSKIPVESASEKGYLTIDEIKNKFKDDFCLDTKSPIVSNDEAIHHFMNQLITFQSAEYPGDGKYVVVGGGGDSMGTSRGFNPFITFELVRRFGQGCVSSNSFASANSYGTGQFSTSTSYTGGSDIVENAFTYMPNGVYYNITVGGSLTEKPNTSNIQAGWRKVRCWYGVKAGGGTLTFTLYQNGIALTPKVVNTSSGVAGSINYVDFTPADGLASTGRLSLTTGGTLAVSHYLGCYMYLQSGFIPVAVGLGGSSYTQALSSPASNLAIFCEAMDMRLCFHAVKEEDLTWVNMGLMMDRWFTQHPKCSHVWVGATNSPTGTLDSASNAAMKAKASSLEMVFVDGQRLMRSVAYLDSIGLYDGSINFGWNEPKNLVGDNRGPHLSLFAHRFMATYIIHNVLMDLRVAGGRFSPATLEASSQTMLNSPIFTANLWAPTTVQGAGSTFTYTSPDLGRLTFGWNNTTAIPVANTYRGGKIMYLGAVFNTRWQARYCINDGNLESGIMASLLFGGGNGQSDIQGLSAVHDGHSLRLVHGSDIIGADQVPFVQIGMRLGGTTAETMSPKYYHSTSTAASPWNGGTWRPGENIYVMELIGNGADTNKRVRIWHQAGVVGSSETRLAARRLIVDHTFALAAGGYLKDPSVYFGIYTNGTPTIPGGNRSMNLNFLEVNRGPKYSTDFGAQDFNY